MSSVRIGHGYDVHKLAENRDCIIGGVKIPHTLGLLGHSDADVLLHAVSDALLGALALGDIGKHFPDTDPNYKNADSLKLLAHVVNLIEEQGYTLGNLDAIVIAQKPKLAPYINQMRKNIADTCHADLSQVSVKATTEERLGFTGREEGISAHCVALLVKK
ncbi:MAG: 2-C-methyl-D-erythritol 2,4-cyclodiphosphate synthase [Oscillospiraceae bacterium]|nr:2-C-methyl-D-erythritol 2,4-cyclodiphosphate synthase [Oscillospiraceae bacterium]